MGLGSLPCFIAETDGDFGCRLPHAASGWREIWLVTHERLRPVLRDLVLIFSEIV